MVEIPRVDCIDDKSTGPAWSPVIDMQGNKLKPLIRSVEQREQELLRYTLSGGRDVRLIFSGPAPTQERDRRTSRLDKGDQEDIPRFIRKRK